MFPMEPSCWEHSIPKCDVALFQVRTVRISMGAVSVPNGNVLVVLSFKMLPLESDTSTSHDSYNYSVWFVCVHVSAGSYRLVC